MCCAGPNHDVLHTLSKLTQAAPPCSDPEFQDKTTGTSVDSLGYKISPYLAKSSL